ncbi:hypothetical protein LTR66_008294 [Elasticomyces elasticus]|nr:hypothetical protein LTR66_008294 [Elasticomyces elasticus]
MSNKIQKTLARQQQKIEEGAYYEAHQQLRVIASRYVKSADYASAIDLLSSGATLLLKAGQGGSGGDLCMFLMEVFQKAECRCDSANKARLVGLLRAFPADGEPYDAERHLTLGTSDSATTLSNLEYTWYTSDEPSTAPLYAARAVFPYLLIGNLRSAQKSYLLFTSSLSSSHPHLAQSVSSASCDLRVYPSLPLLNFLGMLLLAVQRGSSDLLKQLKSHYAAHIKEVKIWDEALAQIGEMYFGVKIPSQTNPLMDMMGSLLMGGGGPSKKEKRKVEAPAPAPAPALD